MNERLFVTHSSVDATLAEALVRLLRTATDVPKESVFCSSMREHGVPTGKDFVEYIKGQLQNTALVVQLVSPAYLDSKFCMWELGATWVRDVETFPLLTSNLVAHSDLSGPLGQKHVSRLDRPGLDELYERVIEKFGGKIVINWSDLRDDFLSKVASIQGPLDQQYKTLKSVVNQRRARYADAMPHLNQGFRCLRHITAFGLVSGDIATRALAPEQQDLLSAAVKSFADVFSAISGTKCRVCIKQFETRSMSKKSQTKVLVSDMVRSEPAALLRVGNPRTDLADENSDFEEILRERKPYFFCNDLVALFNQGKYQNSHWGKTVPPQPAYRAAIVWPIRSEVEVGEGFRGLAQMELEDMLGFLCVDSPTVGVFEDADADLGSCISSALYMALGPWLSALPD